MTLLACLSLFASAQAQADDQRYNQVSLRAEVSQEVPHDRMQVTLYTESQHSDPAQLAGETTRTLNEALQRARQAKGVTVSQGNRSSYPVYEEKGQRIVGWRERAEIRLESGDFAALSKLTADLMQSLKMADMQFSVSDAVAQKTEDALLKEAVAAFRARAQLATEALGGKDYRLVSLSLDGGGNFQPLRGPRMKAAMMDAESMPEIEAGSRQITLNANGVIEVVMP
ncbi:SIMPL domain-containing protein [Stutzerimonas balearica]|uniref:SIMPL domain-containing protein n=1 Tax=Stutzerimonas balearica TaxID=74829 RepID=UPI0028A23DB2|nr:SIMPL domain-containing protein [Stutzerimonas balearica]